MRTMVGVAGALLLSGATVATAQGIDAVPIAPNAPPPIQGNVIVDVPTAGMEATGRVRTFEPQRRLLTLDNGETYLLAATTPGTENLTPGLLVSVTFKIDGTNKIAQEVKAATAVPEADAPALKAPVN